MTAPSARVSSVSESALALGPQDVHLWLCRRQATTSTDIFKRQVLSRYAPVAPRDWRFALGGNGKPAVEGPAISLAFNLSSSGDWVACAVTAGTTVGIDLECCDPQRDVLKLARRFFLDHELAALESCNGNDRIGRFYDYWTLKEARIKSRGGSIARELEATGFGLVFPAVTDAVPAAISTDLPDPEAYVYCCLLDPLADYRLAVCCHSALPFNPTLRLFEQLDHAGVRVFSKPLRAVGLSVPVTP